MKKFGKHGIVILQAAEGETLMYGAAEIQNDLKQVRRFILDLAGELADDATITARDVAYAMMPLDFLIDDVEFKEIKSRVEGLV